MKWPGCDWQPIPLGPRGEHQLELVEDMALLNSDVDYAKILAPDDHDNHVEFDNHVEVDDVLAFEDGFVLAEHPGVNAEAGNLDEPNSEMAGMREGVAAINNEAERNYAVSFPSGTSPPEVADNHHMYNHTDHDNSFHGNLGNNLTHHHPDNVNLPNNNDIEGNRNAIDNLNHDIEGNQDAIDNLNHDIEGNQDAIDNHNHRSEATTSHVSIPEGDFTKSYLMDYKPGSLKP